MKKVEQITSDNDIVSDYDVRIYPAEIRKILSNWFTLSGNSAPYRAAYNGRPLTICVKQVSYLGHPHLPFKKRIQIPKEWRGVLQEANTLLLGIYKYKDNLLFVVFDKTKYANNRLNNSSAHVHSIDIQKAMEYGTFSKTDSMGNHITVCRADRFANFLEKYTTGAMVELPVELDFLDKFSGSFPKTWYGKDCYAEMIRADYRNKYQSEWPGFYFEYVFEKYSDENPYTKRICLFVSDKRITGLDFDLNFNNRFLGDLKCHSEESSGVLGNDKLSFDEAVSKYGRFWYVVLSHSTEKDSNHGYQVTEYWNKAQNKEDLRSYGGRMKYSVTHKNFLVLEVNQYNRGHLKDFHQGHQPSGEPRAVKVLIPNRSIDNFLIFKKVL